jgi:hypothetical protein
VKLNSGSIVTIFDCPKSNFKKGKMSAIENNPNTIESKLKITFKNAKPL